MGTTHGERGGRVIDLRSDGRWFCLVSLSIALYPLLKTVSTQEDRKVSRNYRVKMLTRMKGININKTKEKVQHMNYNYNSEPRP